MEVLYEARGSRKALLTSGGAGRCLLCVEASKSFGEDSRDGLQKPGTPGEIQKRVCSPKGESR
jgi:hypothetical protein